MGFVVGCCFNGWYTCNCCTSSNPHVRLDTVKVMGINHCDVLWEWRRGCGEYYIRLLWREDTRLA